MKSRSLGKNAVYNVVRQISSVVFSLILMPYVTRTLGTEGYGEYNWCLSIVGYFMLVSALGISAYAIREISAVREDREKAYEICRQLFSLNLLSTAVAYLLFFLMLLIWRPTGLNGKLLLILCLEIAFQVVGREWIYNIYEDFRFATIETVLFQVLRTAAVFLLIHSPQDLVKYAIITTGCTAIISCVNCAYTTRYIPFGVTAKLDLKRHLPPILIIFTGSIISSIYLNSDITMLGAIRGAEDVGIYKVSTQVYSMVKTMLNSVVAVMIPRMSFLYNQDRVDDFKELVGRSVSTILLLVVPALFGLYMIADDVVFLLSGAEYMAAVTPLRILSFALLCATVGNICSSGVLLTIRKEKYGFLISVISAGVNVLLNLFLLKKYTYVGAAFTTLIAEILVVGLGIAFARQYMPFAAIVKKFFVALLGGAVIVAVCAAASAAELPLIPGMIVKIGVSCICYGGIIFLFPDTRKLLKSFWT